METFLLKIGASIQIFTRNFQMPLNKLTLRSLLIVCFPYSTLSQIFAVAKSEDILQENSSHKCTLKVDPILTNHLDFIKSFIKMNFSNNLECGQ